MLDFLDSKVDDEASAEQRLTARLKQSIEGAGVGLPFDVYPLIAQGFKAVKDNGGALEIIRKKLPSLSKQEAN